MRVALSLVVRFLLWFVCITCVTSVVLVAYAYVTGYHPEATSELRAALRPFSAAAALVWIPAVLVSGVLSLFAAARGRPLRATSLLPLFGAWTLMLLAGGLLAGVVSTAPPRVAALPDRRVVRIDSYRLYRLSGGALAAPLVVVHDEGAEPGFTVIADERHPQDSGVLLVPAEAFTPLDLSRAVSSYPSMVQLSRWTEGLRGDIVAASRLLTIDGPGAITVVVNLLALSVFLLGCWTLVRLTRWPLFNAAAALGAVRLALWIVPASQAGALRPMLIAAFDSRVLPLASAAVLASLGIGLAAILVFLPPVAEWKHEVHRG